MVLRIRGGGGLVGQGVGECGEPLGRLAGPRLGLLDAAAGDAGVFQFPLHAHDLLERRPELVEVPPEPRRRLGPRPAGSSPSPSASATSSAGPRPASTTLMLRDRSISTSTGPRSPAGVARSATGRASDAASTSKAVTRSPGNTHRHGRRTSRTCFG